jgi:hypothetical protein
MFLIRKRWADDEDFEGRDLSIVWIGSISSSAAARAPCSVEVVRSKQTGRLVVYSSGNVFTPTLWMMRSR